MNRNEIIEDVMLEDLEELEEEQTDVIEFIFAKPVNFEGKEYKKITMNLEGLTGKDIKDVTKEMIIQGESLGGLAETNKGFLAAVAAKSSNLPLEFMDFIPGKDFSKITIEVQNFLLG